MKKKIVILMVLAILSVFVLSACANNENVPAAAWAGAEILTYDIKSGQGEALGTMVTEINRKQSNSFFNEIDGKKYDTADSSFIMRVNTGEYEITTKIIAKSYTPLAIEKTFTNKLDDSESYTFNGYHDGNNFYYSLNGADKIKIKVKSTYAENDFLYSYIRCYDINSLPDSINLFNPLNKSVTTVTTANSGETKVFNVAYPNGSKSVQCNKITVSLTDSPVGKPIDVYLTPDETDYNISSFSMDVSKRFPVYIAENDIVYELTSIKTA